MKVNCLIAPMGVYPYQAGEREIIFGATKLCLHIRMDILTYFGILNICQVYCMHNRMKTVVV